MSRFRWFARTRRETGVVAQRLLLEWGRRKSRLLFWFGFPVAVLLLNGVIVADRAQLSLAVALDFACPATIVGVALFFSCVGGTMATLVTEREQGTFKRLLMSPLSGLNYCLGIGLAHGAIALGQTLILITLSLILGSQYSGSILLGSLIVLLSILTYCGLGFILGTQLAQRPEDVNTLVAAVGVPLLLLGGAFFPVSIFPESLLTIAQFNPIFHMNQAFSQVWTGSTVTDIALHLGVLASTAAIALLLSGWSWRLNAVLNRAKS